MKDTIEKGENQGKGLISMFLFMVISAFIFPMGIILILYGVPEFIDYLNRVRIDKDFTIEYFDAHRSKCIFNGAQIFVSEVEVAYWNKDSLLVSDGFNCYLIKLGKLTYPEYNEEIGCENLSTRLWQKPIEFWTE